MAEPNKENTNPKTGEGNPLSNSGDEQTNSPQQNSEHTNDSGHNRTHKKPVLKRVITFLGNKDNQSLIANFITLGMLIITGLLALYTFRLYRTAIKDSKAADTSAYAANKSAVISDSTLNEIRDYNTRSLAKQQAALDKSDSANKDNFDRIDKSLKIQDSSFKMSLTQFEIENRPFLQVKNVQIDSIHHPPAWIITFDLNNVGKEPLKIIKGGCNYGIETPQFYGNFKEYPIDFMKGDTTINSGAVATERITMPENIMLYSPRFYMVISGEVFYKSDFTKKRHHYKFQIIIHNRPEFTWESNISEND